MKYIIIGAGAAGLSAASAIRKYDAKGAITVLSKEKVEPYSLCSLPAYLSGELDESKLTRFNRGYWAENNITLRAGVEVTRVKPRVNRVEFQAGKSLSYNRLLIATGSKPFVPNISGRSLEGAFTLNSIEDCININKWLEGSGENSRAAVIGGGFIGLEAATALYKRGLSVTVIEMLDGVLPRMVDSDISKLLVNIMKNKGVKVKTSCKVERLEGKYKVEAVQTNKGRVKANIVLWCVGVRPSVDILKSTGIKTGSGIKVNSNLQTNVKNIYAAGDIIESHDLISNATLLHANWPNAVEQGYVAGSNMAGHVIEYSGTFNLNSIDIFDTQVVSIGLTSNELVEKYGKSLKVYRRRYGGEKKPMMNKVLSVEGKFTGFQSVGWPANIGWLIAKLRAGETVPDDEIVRSSLLNDNLKIKKTR
jgi:NADPH-dependent 2,4-dienoyl-CoA reductase/sulfur reductase-like enzyme